MLTIRTKISISYAPVYVARINAIKQMVCALQAIVYAYKTICNNNCALTFRSKQAQTCNETLLTLACCQQFAATLVEFGHKHFGVEGHQTHRLLIGYIQIGKVALLAGRKGPTDWRGDSIFSLLQCSH